MQRCAWSARCIHLEKNTYTWQGWSSELIIPIIKTSIITYEIEGFDPHPSTPPPARGKGQYTQEEPVCKANCYKQWMMNPISTASAIIETAVCRLPGHLSIWYQLARPWRRCTLWPKPQCTYTSLYQNWQAAVGSRAVLCPETHVTELARGGMLQN